MPVKIVALTSTDPREITLDEYNQGRTNFDDHYFVLKNSIPVSFGGQDFYIPWADLENAVDNFCNQYFKDPEDVAVRLVHCYNSSLDIIYMRMQICSMTEPGAGSLPDNVQGLITIECAWYTIEAGTIQVTTDDQLSDEVYLSNFYYTNDDGNSYQQLSAGPNTYVKNLVYPWAAEMLAMYESNGSPMNAMIHFAACSYVESPEASNVTWPHGNVLYLSVNDVPLLDNDDYMVIFENKGADGGTLCPPKCDVYVDPYVA
jgi:hypothetical protein